MQHADEGLVELRGRIELHLANDASKVNIDCDGNRQMLERVTKPVTTYAVEREAEYRAVLLDQGQLPLRFEVFRRGEKLGEVQGVFGDVLQTPTAPIDGVVIFLVTTLAMNNGDPLLALGGDPEGGVWP